MNEDILGYMVTTRTIDACVEDIFKAIIEGRQGTWLACLNPHSYAVSLDNTNFSNALRNANWLVPDGAGIVMASRLLGGKIRQRITGSDIFYCLHQRLNQAGGLSVFFLGSTESTLEQIKSRMAVDYPNIRVAGTYSPPFKPTYTQDELDRMIDAINASGTDVLWVGMTAPKQEIWIHEHRDRLKVKFAGAIGAVFDFYTGKVKRSHPVFQRLGLEWLPRLLQQPRRLWRRMFVSAPLFIWHTLRQKLRSAWRPR